MNISASKVRCDDEDGQNCAVSNNSDNQDNNEIECTSDSRLKEAQNYYKYISEHLDNEMKMYEEKLKNIQLTNQSLKQNLIDMDKEKQRIIIEFHEHYRKLSVNVKLVNQIEEDLQRLKEFLENAKELVSDMQTSKDEGVNQRKYVLESYQQNFAELKKIESIYNEKVEISLKILDEVQQEAKKQQICNDLNEELKSYLKICREKQSQIDKSLQAMLESCSEIETKVAEAQHKSETEANKAKQKFSDFAVQMKSGIQSLISSLHRLKDEVTSEFTAKQTAIDQFKTGISEHIISITRMDKEIADSNGEIKKLKEEIECRRSKCAEIELKIQRLKEQEIENNIMKTNKRVTDIQNWHSVIETKTKQLQSLGEDIKKREQEREIITAEQNKLLSAIDLEKKISEVTKLATSLTQKHEKLSEDILNLRKEKEAIEMQIQNLETQTQQKKLKITELEESLQTSNIESREKIEEQEILYKLLQLKGEQNSSNELVDSELNYLYEQVFEVLHTFTDSEIELKQIQDENAKLDDKIQGKREILDKIMEDTEMCKDSIQALKRNVKEGRATTQQELNKKYNMMMNAKNMEKEKCDKLKNEIRKIKHRINQMSMKMNGDERFDELQGSDIKTRHQKEQKKIVNQK